MSKNTIYFIEEEAFYTNIKLEFLNVARNLIQQIGILYSPHLKIVDLRYNKLITIPYHATEMLPLNASVCLKNNILRWNCNLLWLTKFNHNHNPMCFNQLVIFDGKSYQFTATNLLSNILFTYLKPSVLYKLCNETR